MIRSPLKVSVIRISASVNRDRRQSDITTWHYYLFSAVITLTARTARDCVSRGSHACTFHTMPPIRCAGRGSCLAKCSADIFGKTPIGIHNATVFQGYIFKSSFTQTFK